MVALATATTTIIGKAFDEVFSKAMEAYLAKRRDQAREILLKRMAQGRPWLAIDDKEAFMVMRFARAAAAGAAVRNLELLADAVVTGEQDKALTIDEFKRQADNIADLSWEEIIILATVLRHLAKMDAVGAEDFQWPEIRSQIAGPSHFFLTTRDLDDHAGSLTRTGYLAGVSAYGSLNYRPTARLRALSRLVDLEAAAQRCEAEGRPRC